MDIKNSESPRPEREACDSTESMLKGLLLKLRNIPDDDDERLLEAIPPISPWTTPFGSVIPVRKEGSLKKASYLREQVK